MSSLLKRNVLCLCLLAKTDPALVRAIIEKGNGGLVQSLCECAHNILKGNVPLKKSQKGRLRRYKKDLRALVKGKTALHREETYSTERWFCWGAVSSVSQVTSRSIGY